MSSTSLTEALLGCLRQLSQTRFFTREEGIQSRWQVIAWWEARRIPYNLLVGAVGLVSATMCLVTAILCERFLGDPVGLPDPPIIAVFAVIAYGGMANVCYTGGWIAELIVQRVWPEDGRAFGKVAFFLGLCFSLLLTLIPGVLVVGVGVFRLLTHSRGG